MREVSSPTATKAPAGRRKTRIIEILALAYYAVYGVGIAILIADRPRRPVGYFLPHTEIEFPYGFAIVLAILPLALYYLGGFVIRTLRDVFRR